MSDSLSVFSYRSGLATLDHAGQPKQAFPHHELRRHTTNHETTRDSQPLTERAADRVAAESEMDFSQSSLTELIQYIVSTHHDYIREELPRLHTLAERVVLQRNFLKPEYIEIWRKLRWLSGQLTFHIGHMESEVFPYIEWLERSRNQSSQILDASASQPESLIEQMAVGHRPAIDMLEQLRSDTGGFNPPDDACPDLVALYGGLKELAERTTSHMQLESYVLFPRALTLEKQIMAA